MRGVGVGAVGEEARNGCLPSKNDARWGSNFTAFAVITVKMLALSPSYPPSQPQFSSPSPFPLRAFIDGVLVCDVCKHHHYNEQAVCQICNAGLSWGYVPSLLSRSKHHQTTHYHLVAPHSVTMGFPAFFFVTVRCLVCGLRLYKNKLEHLSSPEHTENMNKCWVLYPQNQGNNTS